MMEDSCSEGLLLQQASAGSTQVANMHMTRQLSCCCKKQSPSKCKQLSECHRIRQLAAT